MDRVGGPQLANRGPAALSVGFVPHGDVAVGEVVDVKVSVGVSHG